MTGANLAGAALIMADLADAYMVDANLCQAYLSGAILAGQSGKRSSTSTIAVLSPARATMSDSVEAIISVESRSLWSSAQPEVSEKDSRMRHA